MTSTPVRLCLDTNIFIHLVEGMAGVRDELQLLAVALDAGKLVAATSERTIAEALVKPMREGNDRQVRAYRARLSDGGGLSMTPVSRSVRERAARLRADNGGTLADSIHLAAAEFSGCALFMSEDLRIKMPLGMSRIRLAEISQLIPGGSR